jgi:predicted ATPase
MPDHTVDTRIPFVGRDAEFAHITDRLARGGRVTLLGTGGVGKSRLALEVASRWEAAGRRARFVALAGVPPESVAATIAAAYGVNAEAGVDAIDALVFRLRGRERELLVLDNCEDAARQVGSAIERLGEAGNLSILSTSRAPLGHAGEERFELAPFTVNDGIGFFRARANLAGVKIDAADPAVAAIVEQLDGLAVALDLAGARLPSLGVERLLHEIANPRPYHFRSSASREPRHHTINHVVDWSLAKLDPLLKRTFAVAGSFAAEFDADDIAALLERTASDASAALEELADQSLVMRSERLGNYRMLVPIRAVALRRLARLAERPAIQERFVARMNARAQTLKLLAEGSETSTALRRLSDAYADFTAALSWSIAEPNRIPLAMDIFATLVALWADGGRFTEGLIWSAKLLDASADLDPQIRGRILYARARIAHRAGEYDLIIDLSPQLIAAFTMAGDRLGLARAYNALGVASLATGRVDEAQTSIDTSLALYRTIGFERGIGAALLNEGNIALDGRRDASMAIERYTEALEITQRSGSEPMIALLYGNIAEAFAALRNPSQIESYARLAIEMFERLGDWARSGWQHQLLAVARIARGDAISAAHELITALDRVEQQQTASYLAPICETAAGLLASARHYLHGARIEEAAKRLRRERRAPAVGYAIPQARERIAMMKRYLAPDELREAARWAEGLNLAELPQYVRQALQQAFEAPGATMVETTDSDTTAREQEHHVGRASG